MGDVIPATYEDARPRTALEAPSLARRTPALRLSRQRWEPWRDWALIALVTHATLLSICLLQVRQGMLVLSSLPLAMCLAVGTLTVLHDAGHRMFGRSLWLNAIAVQTATPLGLWAGHWGRKHRVHHKLPQVYALDEATRPSGLVRLHPAAPRRAAHRWQHLYIWALYGLTWVGELRSQLTFLRTGAVIGDGHTGRRSRYLSFAAEKALCAIVLLPYALMLGVARTALLMLLAMTWTSALVALVLVVGHINTGLEPTSTPPGRNWVGNLMRTTASFSTSSRLVRGLTGGMTHHHVHHLRPLALRSEFPRLHATLVQQLATESGVGAREFQTFPAAVAGHCRRLRELGQQDAATARSYCVVAESLSSVQ
jgi:linoleoyl-CoA desaturase